MYRTAFLVLNTFLAIQFFPVVPAKPIVKKKLAVSIVSVKGKRAKSAPSGRVYSDVFGMTLRDTISGITVLRVEAHTAASAAGVVRADTVIDVNGVPVRDIASLFSSFHNAPRRFTINVRSKAGIRQVLVQRPDVQGQIVFASRKGKVTDIYRVEADGTHRKRLTNTGTATAPVWSPDGTTILYSAAAPGVRLNLDAWTIDREGRGAKRLLPTPFAKTLLRWSPDGHFIYFVSDDNGKWNYYRLPAGGDKAELLAVCSPNPKEPVWTYPTLDISADGSMVTLPRSRPGGVEMAILDPETKTIYPLTALVSGSLQPSWNHVEHQLIVGTPDGFYAIDFSIKSYRQLRPAGFEPQQIVQMAWSPKADYYLMSAHPALKEPPQLYIVSMSGNLRWRLTYDTADDRSPDWTEK